ncbi:hypothetical protein PTKIN_Ptkin03bG0222300 [Pterospermum kingtungense]
MYRYIYGYVAGTPELLRPTMNLFPVNDKSGDVCGRNIAAAPRNLRSMDLFPQHSGFVSPVAKDDGLKRVDSGVTGMNSFAQPPQEPQTAQMTIFYGGQVIVFNDFPADKAKEIMLLASKGSSSSQSNSFNPCPVTSVTSANPIESGIGLPPTSNVVSNFRNNVTQECIQPAQRPIPGDLPIARRASLHRFLEKRKDRITSKAPYQIGNSGSAAAASPSKSGDDKLWLGLSTQ